MDRAESGRHVAALIAAILRSVIRVRRDDQSRRYSPRMCSNATYGTSTPSRRVHIRRPALARPVDARRAGRGAPRRKRLRLGADVTMCGEAASARRGSPWNATHRPSGARRVDDSHRAGPDAGLDPIGADDVAVGGAAPQLEIERQRAPDHRRPSLGRPREAALPTPQCVGELRDRVGAMLTPVAASCACSLRRRATSEHPLDLEQGPREALPRGILPAKPGAARDLGEPEPELGPQTDSLALDGTELNWRAPLEDAGLLSRRGDGRWRRISRRRCERHAIDPTPAARTGGARASVGPSRRSCVQPSARSTCDAASPSSRTRGRSRKTSAIHLREVRAVVMDSHRGGAHAPTHDAEHLRAEERYLRERRMVSPSCGGQPLVEARSGSQGIPVRFANLAR